MFVTSSLLTVTGPNCLETVDCSILYIAGPDELVLRAFARKRKNERNDASQVKGWLCCKLEALQQGLKQSALGQAFQDMDDVQLAAYCIAMLAEYVQEPWLAALRDIYHVPASGTNHCVLAILNCKWANTLDRRHYLLCYSGLCIMCCCSFAVTHLECGICNTFVDIHRAHT